jgi:hypothetical protein
VQKLILTLALVAIVLPTTTGCGDSDESKTTATTGTTTTPATKKAAGRVPASLGEVESGAEDLIDQARSGDRTQVVRTARAVRRATKGEAAADLRKAGVAAARIADLQERARLLETLAPRAKLIRVSLAANAISALMPELYGRYEDPVPPAVLKLDYLDREVQLRSLAGDRASVAPAVATLSATWTALRPKVIDAGGDRVAARYARHVSSMRRLARRRDERALQNEAVTGLELVDELERQFRRQ